MKAVILAAGRGSRLGALTEAVPKPMLRVRGKPIIERNVELCARHGIRRIFINLHHLPDLLRAHLGDGSRWGVRITYKFEPSLLGTAGGVKNFTAHLAGAPFLVLYGDNAVDYDLRAMVDRHRALGADMSLAVFRLRNVSTSGIVDMSPDGRIVKFIEKPAGVSGGWVNAGVYVMEPGLLRRVPRGFSDFGRDVIPLLIREGRRVYGIKMRRKVTAIDTPALYRRRSG